MVAAEINEKYNHLDRLYLSLVSLSGIIVLDWHLDQKSRQMSNTRTVNPKVSILILGYNAKDHFRDCLNSVFNQTFKNVEVVWVDSASTDDSLQGIKTTFSEVRTVEINFNAGYRRAANIGARGTRRIPGDSQSRYADEQPMVRVYGVNY